MGWEWDENSARFGCDGETTRKRLVTCRRLNRYWSGRRDLVLDPRPSTRTELLVKGHDGGESHTMATRENPVVQICVARRCPVFLLDGGGRFFYYLYSGVK